MVTIYFDWNSRNENKQHHTESIINQQNKHILQKQLPKGQLLSQEIPGKLTYHQQYYIDNKERILKHECRTYERSKQSVKAYQERNKGKIREYQRRYRIKKREQLLAYKEKHRQDFVHYFKQYYLDHK